MYRKLKIEENTTDNMSKGNRNKQNRTAMRRGITLTEVVTASALLLTGMMPILKSLTGSHLISRTIENKTQSLAYAQDKLDDIRSRSIYFFDNSFNESSSALGGQYLRSVTESSSGSNLKQITVTVGYDDDNDALLESSEVDVTLSTYVARRW
jgi:hypothetical protein